MELVVKTREEINGKAKKLRESGFIPAELYGRSIENVHVDIPVKEFTKVFKEAGENTVVNIKIAGEERPVLIHDVHKDPLTGEFLNVDLYQVRLDEKIETNVPIEFIGEAPAVKEKGAVLVKATEEIEVEALPNNIPQQIEVDLSVLTDIDQTIYVRDLKIEGEFEILTSPDNPIVTASEVKEEEEETVTEESEQIEGVKVEGASEGIKDTDESASKSEEGAKKES